MFGVINFTDYFYILAYSEFVGTGARKTGIFVELSKNIGNI